MLLSAASGDPVSGSPPTVQVTASDILENKPSTIVSAIGGSSVFDFTGNWWGNLNGPIPEALVGSNINASNWRRSPVQCLITPEDSDGDCLPDAFELTIPGLLPINPDLVWVTGTPQLAGRVAEASFPCYPTRQLQPFLSPDAVDPLAVDPKTSVLEHHRDNPVAIHRLLMGVFPNERDRLRFVCAGVTRVAHT